MEGGGEEREYVRGEGNVKELKWMKKNQFFPLQWRNRRNQENEKFQRYENIVSVLKENILRGRVIKVTITQAPWDHCDSQP